ncbi:MAG: hypothetical protein DRO09_03635 [Thermoprotei archaeon]|nr:MAG: hypothetical protein DRO09_03635 [Thermoprotei archaeon]
MIVKPRNNYRKVWRDRVCNEIITYMLSLNLICLGITPIPHVHFTRVNGEDIEDAGLRDAEFDLLAVGLRYNEEHSQVIPDVIEVTNSRCNTYNKGKYYRKLLKFSNLTNNEYLNFKIILFCKEPSKPAEEVIYADIKEAFNPYYVLKILNEELLVI